MKDSARSSSLSSTNLSIGSSSFPLEGINITRNNITAFEGLIVTATDRLTLRAATGTGIGAGVYVRGRNLTADTLLRNPNGTGGFDGATEVSSEVVKKDIKELDINTVNQFMTTVDIKQFKYKEDDSAGISLIIEDEQADNIPYQDALFTKIQGQILYNN